MEFMLFDIYFMHFLLIYMKYDGVEGRLKGAFPANKEADHKMTVYSLSFSPDGKQIFTASADKTCKLWDVNEQKLISTFQSGFFFFSFY
jgi:WD40 repeat protein